MALDERGVPITKPPWGMVQKYSGSNFILEWEKPLGRYKQFGDFGTTVDHGQSINGGMALIGNKLFVTGTPEKAAFLLDTQSGETLQKISLPHSGSAPPYFFANKSGQEFAVITATGGKFAGYERFGSRVLIYQVIN